MKFEMQPSVKDLSDDADETNLDGSFNDQHLFKNSILNPSPRIIIKDSTVGL